MAKTGMGIWYPNNYGAIADILADLKKMAESIDEPLMQHEGKINNLESDNTTNKANIADLIEALNETVLDLEEVRVSLVETQQHFAINESDTLRIWDLNAGVYCLDNTAQIYYAGATSTNSIFNTDYGFGGGILIVTDGVSSGGYTGKTWILLTNGHYYDGEKVNNGFVIFGFTTETDGTYYQYAIEDLDNVKKAVKYLELNVSKLKQYRTEQAEQIQALQQENSLLKEQVLTGVEEGESIVLKDSSNMPFSKFNLRGNYKQATRSGKNLFDINNVEVGGFNTENGQPLDGITAQLRNIDYIQVEPLTTYTFQAEGIDNVVYLEYDEYKQYIGYKGWFSENPLTFTTLENTKYIKMLLRDTSTTTITIQNLINPQLEKGSTATEYEQYGASPSVEYPSPIQAMGENGSVNEVVCNKNFLAIREIPETTIDGITYSISNGKLRINGTSTAHIAIPLLQKNVFIKANNPVIMSIRVNNPPAGNSCAFNFRDEQEKSIFYLEAWGNKNITKTFNEDTIITSIDRLTNLWINSGFSFNNTEYSLQLEDGEITTNYIPHEEQALTMPIQQPMVGVEDYIDWDNEEEVHGWAKIESYNGEEITTEYISTTGELSTGATVWYKLQTPNKLPFTEAQKAIKEQIKALHSYKNITHIYSTDNLGANVETEYYKDNATVRENDIAERDSKINNLQQQIDEITTLLNTTETSAMLLDNLQADLESEVE